MRKQISNDWIHSGKKVAGALLLTTLAAFGTATDGIQRSYRLRADFTDASHRTIGLEGTIELTHRGPKALQEIPLILYPNRFARALPGLSDLNYRLIYPHDVSKGGIEFSALRVNGRGASLRPWEGVAHYPPGTLQKLALPAPWPAGQVLKIEFVAKVAVPEKYGSYGRYKKALNLAGGWYPYVPAFAAGEGFLLDALPPAAAWDLELAKAPRDDLVLQGETPAIEDGRARWRSDAARQVSVALRPKMVARAVQGRRYRVRILTPRSESEDIRRSFEELAQRWLDFVEKQPGLDLPPKVLTWVEAPTREALARQGERMTFVSDRTFKLLRSLRQYHTAPAVAGLFYQLFFDAVVAREDARRYDVVLELLSWHWAEKFMSYSRYVHRDARNLGAVKAFSFVPIVDQMLYSPQFAFVDTFYDMAYPWDPVRDDALRFNHRRARGRTLLVHVEDEVSPAVAAASIERYLGETSDYQSLVEELGGRRLDAEFERWLKPREPVNYAVGKPSSTRTPDGYAHAIPVKKEARPEDPAEPVELLVRAADGETKLAKWDGVGEDHTYRVTTKGALESVRLDPRGRLLETRLADNQRPPEMKFLLDTVIMNYDFNQKRPEFVLAGQFRRKYGGLSRYHLGGFTIGEVYGGSVAYTRLFGRLIDRLRLTHGLSVGYQFQHAVDDRVVVAAPGGPVSAKVDGATNLSAMTFTYFTANQVSYTNPLGGGYASASALVGSDLLGGDRSYYGFDIAGSWVWRILGRANHLFAVKGSLGTSLRADMPTQAYRRLGGLDTMRGVSFSEDRFRGRHMLLTSAEYRHFIKQDVDWNLGFFRVRDLQGALFADAGRVAATVQEKADALVLGPAAGGSSGFVDLFDVPSLQTDVGYGIRFHIEYFGVNPSLIRLDAAKSLNQANAPLRYYFGVTQSF